MCAKKLPVLILDPPTELRFKGDNPTCELRITNLTDEQVCYKIKTTASKQFTVRPNVKLLLPQESQISTIKFHAPPDISEVPKRGYKFMVQHVIPPPGEITNIQDLWKNTKNKDIMTVILNCVFEKDKRDSSTQTARDVELQSTQSSSLKQVGILHHVRVHGVLYSTTKSTEEDVLQKPVEKIEIINQEKKIYQQSEKGIESESNKIQRLENKNEALIKTNIKLSKEVARLMSVDNERNHYKEQLEKRDAELQKSVIELSKKEQQLQTTEITLTTFREDFEAERKDRENAHNIKEEEIKRAREEIEKCKAGFDKRFYDAKQSLEAQVSKQQKQLEKQLTQLERIGKSKQELTQKYRETIETNKNLHSKTEELEDKIKQLEDKIKQLEGKIKETDESLRITKLIDLDRDIGEGGNGVVKEVLLHGKICAAKVVHRLLVQNVGKKQFECTKQKFLKELEIYSKLVHPNIVQFLGIYYPGPDDVLPWLVMERLATNLTSFLGDFNQEQVTLHGKISLLHDVTLGIQYLHDKGIIHRDLSSNNILLTNNLQAKIADYGVAKSVDPTIIRTHTQAPGTTIFMPPEALALKPRYGTGVDVFSFGCILIHTVTHQLPIPIDQVQTDPVSLEMKALSEVERRESHLKSMQSFPLFALTKKCLSNDSRSRPSVNKILEEVAQLLDTFETENSLNLHVQYTMEIQKLKTLLNEKENKIVELNESLTALQNK